MAESQPERWKEVSDGRSSHRGALRVHGYPGSRRSMSLLGRWSPCAVHRSLSDSFDVADRHVVFLRLARRAPAVTLGLLQHVLQGAHDVGSLGIPVSVLGQVLAQVEEFAGLVVRDVTALL